MIMPLNYIWNNSDLVQLHILNDKLHAQSIYVLLTNTNRSICTHGIVLRREAHIYTFPIRKSHALLRKVKCRVKRSKSHAAKRKMS